MKPFSRILVAAVLLISISANARAQQSVIATAEVTQGPNLSIPAPGPLALAARAPYPAIGINAAILSGHGDMRMRQMTYQRIDWELGRAWLGTLIGFAYAYIGDLLIHYEDDFSKAHYLLNEDKNGDNVYNVLLFCGIPPYYAMRGIRSVNISRKNSLGSYLFGLAGSVAGLAYWTSTGDAESLAGFAVYSGLTTILAEIGYHLF
jgi:hypothetical protein